MHPEERRVDKRKAPEHLAYLSLPFDNGGIVTDLSAGGLGFQAIAPVKSDGPIHFRFAMDSSTRIRAVGELAWIDKTGKSGGLRFTQLSDDVREQIRIWTGQSQAREEVSFDDGQIAEPAIATTVSPSGGADVVCAVNANALASVDDIQIAESAAIPLSDSADIFGEVSANASVETSIDDVQITESAIPATIALSDRAGSARAARPNHLLYSLKSPIYSAPFYTLSMFPLPQNLEARLITNSIPAPVADPFTIARSHPIAAVGLTIALALLVSMGILVFLTAILEGESIFDWGEKAPGATYSQAGTRNFVPPSIPASGASKITLR